MEKINYLLTNFVICLSMATMSVVLIWALLYVVDKILGRLSGLKVALSSRHLIMFVDSYPQKVCKDTLTIFRQWRDLDPEMWDTLVKSNPSILNHWDMLKEASGEVPLSKWLKKRYNEDKKPD